MSSYIRCVCCGEEDAVDCDFGVCDDCNIKRDNQVAQKARKEALEVACGGVRNTPGNFKEYEIINGIRAEFARRWPEEFSND